MEPAKKSKMILTASCNISILLSSPRVALPVTGIHVGHGSAHSARVVSASLDMTVKIHSMITGALCVPDHPGDQHRDGQETGVWVGDKAGSACSAPRVM